jgi:hypothetical protein
MRRMSICLTGFPISGLGGLNIYQKLVWITRIRNIVGEFCTRIDGCRIIENVCVDY